MSNSKLTDAVMDRVVSFETRRTRTWVMLFAAVAAGLIASAGTLLFLLVSDLRAQGAGDMLAIIFEDPEIVAEYLSDVVSVLWISMRQEYLVVGVALLVALVTFVILTSRQRSVVRRRMGELAKFPDGSHNTLKRPREASRQ